MVQKNLFWQRYLVTLLITFFAVACNGNDAPTPLDTDHITIYTPLPINQAEVYLEAFASEYPDIEFDFIREPAPALTNRLLNELDDPQADVIWGLPIGNMLVLEWYDLLKTYAPVGLERIPPDFYDVNTPPHWVGMTGRILVFLVNTVELNRRGLPAPESWEDLLDPIYKGRIVISSSTTSASGYIVLATVLQRYGETEGWEYLDALHQQVGIYARNANRAAQLVGEGGMPIGLTFGFRAAEQNNAGNPVRTIFLTDGSGWDTEANALVKKDTIKPNARTFLDWAISDSAMTLYAKNRIIVTADAFEHSTAVETVEGLMPQDTPWIAANNKRILQAWSELYADEITVVE